MIQRTLAAFALSLTMPVVASANVLTINSPDIKKGITSLEVGMRWDLDDDKAKDHFREYALEAEHGITDYWGIGFEFVAEREHGEGTRYAVTAMEHTFQFLRQGKDAPFSLGLRVEYEKAHVSDATDEAKARLLLRYRNDRFEGRFNIGGDREVGDHAERGFNGDVRMSLRYRVEDYFIPALDYLGSIGRVDAMPGFDDQTHRLGPVIYGHVNHAIGYQVGYLAGISAAAPDHTLKLAMEYKF